MQVHSAKWVYQKRDAAWMPKDGCNVQGKMRETLAHMFVSCTQCADFWLSLLVRKWTGGTPGMRKRMTVRIVAMPLTMKAEAMRYDVVYASPANRPMMMGGAALPVAFAKRFCRPYIDSQNQVMMTSSKCKYDMGSC